MVKFNLNTKDPSVRDMLISKLDELGEQLFEKTWEVSPRTVREWKRLRNTFGDTKPRYSHKGRPGKLSSREERRMTNYLIKNPYATNDDLAKQVNSKISGREAGRIIDEHPMGFRWMLEQEDVERSFSQDNYEAGRKFINTNKNIKLAKRIYVDETRISSRVRRRRGRFPAGVQPHSPKNVKYPGHVVICAIKNYDWLHPGIISNKGGLKTEEFEDYVENTLVPLLEEGDVVYWDRWGRSGQAKNPTAHHFSPKARKLIQDAGAKLVLLPPTGKLLDPIEPLFGDVKRIYDKKLGSLTSRMDPSKVTLDQKKRIWREAERALTHESFVRAYKERANGQEFFRVAAERGLIEQ
jgi:hypothetical protein